ncbi:MAG: hypothetical protein H6Q31_1968 [Bacteroidetes bacterium]|jgi:hypothetical protein|nr:hypothetical protein [Bacteroidota bacterium]
MVHLVYIGIAACCAGLVVVEMFSEKRWREQLALVLILIPLVLRILHIK